MGPRFVCHNRCHGVGCRCARTFFDFVRKINRLMFIWLALIGLFLGFAGWLRIVLATLSFAGISPKKQGKAAVTDDAERKAIRIVLLVTAIWLAAFAALGLTLWNRIPAWSKWLCGAMMPSPLISLAWFVVWRRRSRIRPGQSVSLSRNPPRTTIRVLVALTGVLAGWSVYSYGMFHTLHPTWVHFADVASCGMSPDVGLHSTPAITLGDEGGTLCQVAPGKWRKSPYNNDPFFLGLAIAFLTALIALAPFVRWATGSAWKFGVLGFLLWGIPMTLLGLQLNFVEGTLTPDWALHVVVYSELIAAIGSVLGYPMLRRSLLKRSRGT
jgi:hypothetical protein